MLLAEILQRRFAAHPAGDARDELPDFWLPESQILAALAYLRQERTPAMRLLFDLTAREEETTAGSRLCLVYHLHSLQPGDWLRLRVPLAGEEAPSCTEIYPAANWYEREVYDLFGIRFRGHPDLRRLLLSPDWVGHPLRKAEPIRATERPPLRVERGSVQEQLAVYNPEDAPGEGEMLLNVGPHHPGTHGILRYRLRLRGERVLSVDPDIGYHHRGVEKIAEGHSYHNFIPYTDRVDYLGGVLGEWPYLRAVETLAGITVPERAEGIRTLLAEICRIESHLVWLGSYGNDLGTMGPAFYAFRDRSLLLDLIEDFTGGRLHPQFFRIGGVAADLPEDWREKLRSVLDRVETGLRDTQSLSIDNAIFRARTRGIGKVDPIMAERWGATSIVLRSTGTAWDLRKTEPYGLYPQLRFAVPTATDGDAWSRTALHLEEIHESIGMLRQLVERMPNGPVLAHDAPTALMPKERTLQDIETLIHHFEQMAAEFGPPAGVALGLGESARGMLGYFVCSDGGPRPQRLRVRTGSFPHVQMITELGQGLAIPDFIASIGSLDYVLADLDR
ncbi:NADH-quinone oxidoreductase subunit D [Acidithiobacillus sp. AMEEHan]|uniref:NADH-quinone oxidoreductase subunit D n=1 Tax=Acidithiobacillus sp. AMEEHan TaxID=2994951 RepID=UPI0027E40B7A|nr:NADH-quinone oxidoreductase subunit D [Acidithiobacillus sp. AMEEHan]